MNILFVCTGNTCRSAMAEGLLKKMFSEKGINIVSVSSCGTDASPLFYVPRIVLDIMARRGVDLSKHKSAAIDTDMVDNSDLIIVMDNYHRNNINSSFPNARGKVHLLKEFVKAEGVPEIADPIGMPDEIYKYTAKEIEICISKLLDVIVGKTVNK